MPTCAQAAAPVNACGTISTDTVWTAANVYVVNNCAVTVSTGVTLTVQPGTVVKFTTPYDALVVQGTLSAQGTSGAPIVFTSARDGSGAARGDWAAIRFEAGSHGRLSYAVVAYGGSGRYDYGARYNQALVESFGNDVALDHVTLHDSGRHGLYTDNTSVSVAASQVRDNNEYGLHYNGVDTVTAVVVSDTAFSGNGSGAGWLVFRDAQGTVTTERNTATGPKNGFRVSGNLTGGLLRWNNGDDLPLLIEGGLSIAAGAKLTLDPGAVAKFGGAYDALVVRGELAAEGTDGALIAFTSVADDSHGGDTDGAGPSAGAPAQWSAVRFEAGSKGRLAHAFVGYGGSGRYDSGSRYNKALIESFSSDVTLDSVTLQGSGLHGLYAENASVPFTQGAVRDNAQYGLYYNGVNAGTPVMVSDTAFSGNGAQAGWVHFTNGAGTVTFERNTATGGRNGIRADGRLNGGSLRWNNGDDLPLLIEGGLTIAPATTLRLEAGTVVKFASAYEALVVEGRLDAAGSAGAEVAFTSITDDDHGGDTDGGGPTTGAPGQWAAIRFAAGSTGRLTYAFVGYGGSGRYDTGNRYDKAMVESYSSDVTLDHCTLHASGTDGLYAENATVAVTSGHISDNARYGLYYNGLDASVPLTVTDNVFGGTAGTGARVELRGNPPAITFQRNTSTGGGFVGGFSVSGTISSDAIWDNTGSLPLVISGGLTIAPEATVTVRPGTVVKFAEAYDVLFVQGSLIAAGTAEAPIAFTSLRDDAHGGDTNGDGASTASPGDWSCLRFAAGSHGQLAHVFAGYGGSGRYDYAGRYNRAMVESYASDVTLDAVSLASSGIDGLYAGGASVSVTNSTATGNAQYGLRYEGIDANVPLVVDDNKFGSNGAYGAWVFLSSGGVISADGNQSLGSKNGFRVSGTLASGSLTWKSPAQPLVVDGGLGIAAGATLTLVPGSVVKFAGPYDVLQIAGALSATGTFAAPIAFTSIADDAHGGDTNGDGASSGSAGQWAGLRLLGGGSATLEQVFIGYGGSGRYDYLGRYNRSLVEAFGGDLDIKHATLTGSGLHGLYTENTNANVTFTAITTHAQYGVYNATPAATVDARHNWWGDASGPQHPTFNPSGTGSRVSDGVRFEPWLNRFTWLEPTTMFLHGVAALSWRGFDVDPATLSVDAQAIGAINGQDLGRDLPATGEVEWDTRPVANGAYELRAGWRDTAGTLVAEAVRSVVVNNDPTLVWHGGRLTANETWDADAVHVVDDDVIVGAGIRLTIQPGTIVKFAPGTRIVIEDGGIVDATATEEAPIIFTSIADDTSGDTNLDGAAGSPHPGDWNGIVTSGTGQFNDNDFVEIRYSRSEHSGALAASERWDGSLVHQVTGDVTVPNGIVLTIEAGAVVKLDTHLGIVVQPGGQLIANGSVAQPIVFTSSRDDTAGGDTNGDGTQTTPQPGDWRWIYVDGAVATFDHVELRYGSGTASGGWDQTGMIRTTGAASLTVSNSILRDAFFDGILAWGGTATIRSTLLTRIDRAVSAHPGSPVQVINCTVDDNLIGLLVHGGTMDVVNTIVSNNHASGIQYDFGTLTSVRFSDVWAPAASGYVNYRNTVDQTGSNGNISRDPHYVDREHDNYRLDYRSPAIDAADGSVAPGTDAAGAPRYDDPRTANTGTATPSGAYADMGAYEFVETAASNLDLVVAAVSGPTAVVAGDTVRVQWTITNIGSGEVVGPWHDTVNLVLSPDANPTVIFAGEVLVGEGVKLGPGQRLSASADIRVPGSIVAEHQWQVVTNMRGEVFEGRNRANNATLSLAPVKLDLPELVVGGAALSRQFSAADESHWFKFTPSANQDVSVRVDRAGAGGSTELYLGQGYMPSRERFDVRQNELNAPDVSALAASTAAQTYYVLAYPAALPGGAASFTISARALDFSLDAVGPQQVGNAGTATLTLHGGQLRSDMTFEIVDALGGVHAAKSVFVSNSSLAYVTFDLSGLPLGTYSVRARDGARTATLADGVRLIAATPGNVQAHLTMPSAMRPDWTETVIVDYTNVGNTDAVAPLMVLSVQNAKLRLPGKTEFASSTVQLLGINMEGPAGILPPGAHGTITLDMMPTIGNGTIDATVRVLAKPQQVIDWNAMKNQMRPAFVPADAWEPIFANFTAEVGSTLGGYQAVLADNATYLSRLGEYTQDIERLLAFELRQAALGDLVERYSLGAFGRGAPSWWEMNASAAGEDAVAVRAGSQMRTFLRQPDGSYGGVGGDAATLTVQSGAYRLREANGSIFAFRTDGKFDYAEDSAGRRVTATYSGSRLTHLSDAAGNTLSYSYDGNGHVTEVVDPSGRVTTYEYDASGEHLIHMTGPDGETTFEYVTGQGGAREHALQSVRYADGTNRSFEYDERGRLVREYTGGEETGFTYAYDSAGGITTTDAAGAVQTLLFNDVGQLARVTDASGNTATVAYHQGQATRMVGPGGASSLFEYDAQGNLTRVIDPAGSRVTLAYEPDSNRVTSVVNARGATLGYEYDAGGDLSRIIYPDANSEHFAFDAGGNLTTWTNARGQTVAFAYDEHGLLARKTLTGHAVTLDSDAHRNLTSVAVEGRGTTRFEYDAGGRLTRMTTPEGRFLEMSYDDAGRLIRKTDHDGFVANYGYDGAGRLATLTDADGATIVSYLYDAAGRLMRKEMGNGTSTSYAYDLAGAVLSVVNRDSGDSLISRYDYTYDVQGRRIGMQTPDGDWSYTYDAAGQLTRAVFTSTNPSVPSQDLTYEYDAAGNRVRTRANGATATYVANAADQYLSDGTASFRYDADGNLAARDAGAQAWQYGYDEEGRLVSADGPDGSWSWEYDAFGQRVASVHNGERVEYLIDPLTGDVVAEYAANGALIARYEHGLGLVSRRAADGSTAYYHFDALGSTTEMTGQDGSVVNRYAYSPFGNILSRDESVANEFEFLGELDVAATAGHLSFMRRRYFDPTTGRFLQRDPAGVNGGANLYAYSGNDPINAVDPTGLGVLDELVEVAMNAPLEAKEIWELRKILTDPKLSRGSRGLFWDQFFNAVSEMSPRELTRRFGAGEVTLQDIRLTKLRQSMIDTAAKKPFLQRWVGKAGNAWRSSKSWFGGFTKRMSGYAGRVTTWAKPYAAKALHLAGRAVVVVDVAVAIWDSASWAAGKLGWQDVADAMDSVWTAEGLKTAWDYWFGSSKVVSSHDPNDIIGPAGSGTARWIAPDQTLPYTIRFENDKQATAPAQVVRITEHLDPDLDFTTFQLGSFSFDGVVVPVPAGRTFYSERLDLRATYGLYLDISANLDFDTGTVTWEFASVDPVTGTTPRDPLTGFLPPNVTSPIGEGYVTYTIRPRSSSSIGTPISAEASIVFDTNEPIDTPQHRNPVGPIADCTGDCDNHGTVTIDELLTLVNIALDNMQVQACAAGDQNTDGAVTIDEILAAVNYALNGCPAGSVAGPDHVAARASSRGLVATPTPTPTPTATATPTPSATPKKVEPFLPVGEGSRNDSRKHLHAS